MIPSAGVTDTGRRRRRNEDAYVCEPPLFAIADGMGGAQAGEVASRLAAAVLEETTLDAGGGRELRRDLARARPAHPVRDREERRRADEGVLVVVPAPAAVGRAGGAAENSAHSASTRRSLFSSLPQTGRV